MGEHDDPDILPAAVLAGALPCVVWLAMGGRPPFYTGPGAP
jgi:hypothetical protein